MKPTWNIAMLAGILWCSAAYAAIPGASELFDTCQGLDSNEISELSQIETQQVVGLGSVFASKRHFVALNEGGTCLVFERRSRRANSGTIKIGSPPIRLEVLVPVDCWQERCPVLLATPTAVAFLNTTCDAGLEVSVVKPFTGQKTAQIVCRQSAGAGTTEVWYWVHLLDGVPTVILSAPTGHSEDPTEDEQKLPGFRRVEPTGCLVVTTEGLTPAAAAVIPADVPEGPQIVHYRWNSQSNRFVSDEKTQMSVKCPKRPSHLRGRP